jgi:hypothetical protein
MMRFAEIYKVDIKAINYSGSNAVLVAAEHKNFRLVERLIEKGINYECCDISGRSILFYVLINNQLELAQKIINQAPELYKQLTGIDIQYIISSVSGIKDEKIIDLLLQDTNQITKIKMLSSDIVAEIFKNLVFQGNVEVINKLFTIWSNKILIEICNPLVFQGNIEVINKLLSYKSVRDKLKPIDIVEIVKVVAKAGEESKNLLSNTPMVVLLSFYDSLQKLNQPIPTILVSEIASRRKNTNYEKELENGFKALGIGDDEQKGLLKESIEKNIEPNKFAHKFRDSTSKNTFIKIVIEGVDKKDSTNVERLKNETKKNERKI